MSSFSVVLISCKVNFHVVRSALQNSTCLLCKETKEKLSHPAGSSSGWRVIPLPGPSFLYISRASVTFCNEHLINFSPLTTIYLLSIIYFLDCLKNTTKFRPSNWIFIPTRPHHSHKEAIVITVWYNGTEWRILFPLHPDNNCCKQKF